MVFARELRTALQKAIYQLEYVIPLSRVFTHECDSSPSPEDFGEIAVMPRTVFNRAELNEAKPKHYSPNVGLRLKRILRRGRDPRINSVAWPEKRPACQKCRSIFVKIFFDILTDESVQEVAMYCCMCGEIVWYFEAGRNGLTSLEIAKIRQSDQEMEQAGAIIIPKNAPAKERVLAAVKAGLPTSAEISKRLSIDFKSASAWLSLLCSEGKIEKVAEIRMDYVGARTNWYEAVAAGACG